MTNRIFSKRPQRRVLATAIFAVATSSSMLAQAAMLEEVVVTAQKKTQNLQDVPISVSVTSGEQLDNFSIGDIGELSASIPNVTIGQNATQDSVTIRGIGSGANHGFEQSVGTFIDGVYFGRGRSSRSPFLDIERVEILKGPQGVLFGKNTIAGALNITTRKPTDEFEASLEGEYFDAAESVSATAVVSGPITDNVAGRLVVKYTDADGFVDNIATGNNAPEIEETVVRGSLAWDASDRLNVALKGEISSYDMDGRHLQMVEGGPFRELFESVDPQYEQKLDDKRSTNNPVFGRDFDNTDAENFTATLSYDFDSVRLVSVTAYTHYDYNNNIPASWVANLDTAAKRYDEDHTQYSQELRLESSGDGSLEYIFGVFYQNEELEHLQHFDFDTTQAIADGFPLPPFVGRETFDLEQDTDSYAAFGQLTWHFNDRLRTTLGLRYTSDEKDLNFSRVTTGALPFSTYQLKDDRDDSDVTPSFNVQYDLGEDAMVYLSFSQGFKSGGFDFESGEDFEEETVDAWEAGIKSQLADGAVELNASVFRSEFSDLQVAAWNGMAFETGNAAEATTEGLEVDGRWQISDNWMVSGSLAYLNAEYDDFSGATCTAQQQTDHRNSGAPGGCLQDLSGEELQFSPEWAGSVNLEYFRSLGPGLDLTVQLGADYSDEFYSALDLDPNSKQDSFTKVHARIQLASEAGWSVALVGKNLTDEETTMWVNDMPFFRGAHFAGIDRTRSIGLQAIAMHNDPATMANVASQNTVVDDGVGKVLAALEAAGLVDSTLVIFSTDQGNFYGQHGLWQHTVVTTPANLYEAVLNIPLIIRHPGAIAAGSDNHRLIGQYDLPATILDYLGVDVVLENSPGSSFAGQLRGEDTAWDDEVFYEQEESRGIRTPKFAYWKRLAGTGSAELYDMKVDPGQHHNLIDDPAYRARVAVLDSRLAAFFGRYSDPKYDLWQGGVAKGSVIRPEMFRTLYGPEWAPRTDLLEAFSE